MAVLSVILFMCLGRTDAIDIGNESLFEGYKVEFGIIKEIGGKAVITGLVEADPGDNPTTEMAQKAAATVSGGKIAGAEETVVKGALGGAASATVDKVVDTGKEAASQSISDVIKSPEEELRN